MTRDEYMIEIQRTWNDDDWTQAEQLSNAALGLVGESLELTRDPTSEELGDVMYYAHTMVRLLSVPAFSLYPWEAVKDEADLELKHLVCLAAEIAENIKKLCYHGIDDDRRSKLLAHIDECLGCMVSTLDTIADEIGGPEAVRAQNIAKLRARYPDGFVAGGGNR